MNNSNVLEDAKNITFLENGDLVTYQLKQVITRNDGNTLLSNRELEILFLVSIGYRSNEIANKLYISPLTVSTHRKKILKKLRAKTTPHMVSIAIAKNII